MQGTSPRRRHTGAGSHLTEAERLNPEWQPWLRLLRLALAELAAPGWEVAVRQASDRGVGAPLLDRAVIAVPERLAGRWLAALLAAVQREEGGGRRSPLTVDRTEPLGLLEAAIRMDPDGIGRMAATTGAEPAALGSVAQLAAMPILHACRRLTTPGIPAAWPHGYCPVCGAWPALAEMRGLERRRYMRCGRCGSDWRLSVLRCPFCDEIDHERLGALAPDGEEETRRVDTCRSCMGYVKSVTTLAALADDELAALDVATLYLDLVAAERGFGRPERPGWAPSARVVARESLPATSGGGSWH